MKRAKREARLREAAKRIGTEVVGRYRLVRLLGDGGMGSVFKAADKVLRRFVAVKILHASAAANPASVERFEREARAAAAVDHPNITKVLDFGSDGDRPFLVMEYLRGRSLSQALAADGQFSVRRACAIATHTLNGLTAAHSQGIIHRDLKPANLMLIAYLGDRDFVKVCDFGFAALTSPSERFGDDRITPVRTLVGTPAYAAPERLRGDATRDPRVDVYAIGVVLYEMLAGKRPFVEKNFKALVKAVRAGNPPKLTSLRSGLPNGLEDIVMRALHKDRSKRWESAADFASELVPFGGRFVPRDEQADSFTMDLLQIKARANNPGANLTADEADLLMALRDPSAPIEAPEEPTQRIKVSSDRSRLTAPHSASSDLAAAAPPAWRGSIIVPVLEKVDQRFGSKSLNELITQLPDDIRQTFRQGVDARAWVPTNAVIALFEAIDASFGDADMRYIVECGRAAAHGVLPHMGRAPLPVESPLKILERWPAFSTDFVRGYESAIRRVGTGYARLRVREPATPSLTMSVAFLGMMEELLVRAGGREVEVAMVSCRALDDEETLLDITWLQLESESRSHADVSGSNDRPV